MDTGKCLVTAEAGLEGAEAVVCAAGVCADVLAAPTYLPVPGSSLPLGGHQLQGSAGHWPAAEQEFVPLTPGWRRAGVNARSRRDRTVFWALLIAPGSPDLSASGVQQEGEMAGELENALPQEHLWYQPRR